jgi:OOP family OmpA-OmpF porin
MEISGHTDAQGSEGGNKALSQARAEAVLLALQGRRVDISGMNAVGYGEASPIANNGTEEGREANRRIEFVLKGVQGAEVAAEAAPADADASPVTAPAEGEAAPAAGTEAAPEEAAPQPATAAEGAPEADAPAPAAAPDFSGDTSPSVAPTEKTIRPLPRPEDLEAEGNP